MEAPGSPSDNRDTACDKRLRSPRGRKASVGGVICICVWTGPWKHRAVGWVAVLIDVKFPKFGNCPVSMYESVLPRNYYTN